MNASRCSLTYWLLGVLWLAGWVGGTATGQSLPQPPVAPQRPHGLNEHGVQRNDPYYWMNQREDPELLAYLRAENEYTDAMMSDTQIIRDQLFREIRDRIPQTDYTVPYPENGWAYFSRTIAGQDYPLLCRQPASASEQPAENAAVVFDVNQLAQGKSYCQVASMEVNPQGKILAYSVDFQGRRIHSIGFRDLDSGRDLEERIENVAEQVVWAADGQTLFYCRQDPETLRIFQVYRHRLGTDPADDVLVYEERDDEFNLMIGQTRSKKFLLIIAEQTTSSEVLYLPSDQPEAQWLVFEPRSRDHEYTIDHLGDEFVVLSNWEAENFRLLACRGQETHRDQWRELIPHRPDTLLEDFELFESRLVTSETRQAQTRLQVWDRAGKPDHQIEFDEPVYLAQLAVTEITDTDWLRFEYTSPTTPPRTMEYHLGDKTTRVLKEQALGGGFDRDNYRCLRLWATARDGTSVPVTVVHRREVQADGTAPGYVYGYGSYGISMEPAFNPAAVSLLDRGFVMAVAHIRGGQEMGRQWYEQGKLLHKMNTFTDFIDVTEFLIAEKWMNPKRVFAQGGSAGGLLMGAVINLRPDLYRGVIADVPFVDVVTTMLDESIPLTTFEFDEWGNPKDRQYFDYMLSYSPYDQVRQQTYPHLLVTSGLYDSQVQYWEPTKWVAKLRQYQTPGQILLLKTNMSAGHGGASARTERYRETAFDYAFLLKLAR